jgi:dUTPase
LTRSSSSLFQLASLVARFNLSSTDFSVKTGDRIAQLILERIYTPAVVEVEVRLSSRLLKIKLMEM